MRYSVLPVQLDIKVCKNSLIEYFSSVFRHHDNVIFASVYAVGKVNQLHSDNCIPNEKRYRGNSIPRPYGRGVKLGRDEAPHDLTVGVSSPRASSGAKSLRSETSSLSSASLRSGYFAKGDKRRGGFGF